MAKTAKKPKPESAALSSPKFSRPILVTFALIFAVIGGYAIYKSFAAGGTTYYVSSSGSDSNSGTSTSSPWRTISKVQDTCFNPGDTVAFAGGQTFSDNTMNSSCSGTSSAPITFTSYGTGRAVWSAGVWLSGGLHDLTFDNLDITNASDTAFTSCGSCSSNPVYNIIIQNSFFHDTPGVCVQSSTNDHDWLVQNNSLQHCGDNGILNYYTNNFSYIGNTITDTGWNTSTGFAGYHGIYSKGANVTIANNNFSNCQNGQCISVRTHGQYIYGNVIHDTPYAMAFFDYDTGSPPQGTSYIYDNLFYNISSYEFYDDGGADPQGNNPSVNFVIANNTFVNNDSGSEMLNLSTVPSSASVTTVNNIFTGSYGSAYRGCATCTEHNNDWYGGSSNIPSGSGDLHVNPNLSAAPALALSLGSPLIDAGTTSVPGLAYSLNSDGAPLHYSGAAPDMGAVEFGSSGGGGGTTPPPGCYQSSTAWQNQSFTNQTGSFNVDFDSTPAANNIDAGTGLSSGPAGAYTDLAATVRFNSSGFIDAINGAGYASAASVPYSSGTSYHFKLAVNTSAHTYSIYVTPAGGSQITLGANYAFRASQAGITNLNNWALEADSGSHSVCNFSLSAATTIPGDTNNDNHVTLTDLTNLLANWNTNNTACDFNNDGTVGGVDLSILLSHYGN